MCLFLIKKYFCIIFSLIHFLMNLSKFWAVVIFVLEKYFRKRKKRIIYLKILEGASFVPW